MGGREGLIDTAVKTAETGYTSLMIGEDLSRYSPWVLRLVLDRRMLIDKDIKPQLIVAKIKSEFYGELDVCASDENAAVQVIRCRIIRSEDKLDSDGDELKQESEDILLRQIEAHILNAIPLNGTESISRVFMVEKKHTVLSATGKYEQLTEWVLETDGINLQKVLTVDHVDVVRTYSNSIVEVLEVLGIEAARAALLTELRNVIEFDGSYVNYRHLALLCDVMTKNGRRLRRATLRRRHHIHQPARRTRLHRRRTRRLAPRIRLLRHSPRRRLLSIRPPRRNTRRARSLRAFHRRLQGIRSALANNRQKIRRNASKGGSMASNTCSASLDVQTTDRINSS